MNPGLILFQEWIRKKSINKQLEKAAVIAKRAARQAARKQHRAELMIPYLENLNFVLYWPHCFHAHPELYEKWDINS
ncbi:Uncharacterized protein OBRU01_06848 [Operophtera brumata]|uniref:Uncharacterized protein n=1 Tax=Operophtera brumata TaxID=104452 RepID=A0A0L7LK49_OPEBR|nr:Uncharacterized protein OBRU01_06848 [Operophtera brumata]